MLKFKTQTVEDTELIYSILRERHPNKQIEIEFNDNTKEYTLNVTNKEFKEDPEVPLDVNIKVVYGDTDSIFVSIKFNRNNFELNRKDAFKLAIVCGDNLTKDIFKRPPIELEFEKVYQPFILLTKKRYIGKKFEDTRDPLKLKTLTTAGIALTRRDYCQMVKKCYKEVIDKVMEGNDNSLEDSLEIFKNYIERIENYQIDFDDLVVSAMLAKSYSCSLCKEKTEWNVLKCSKVNCKENNVTKRSEFCTKCKTKFKCLHTFSLAHVNLAVTLLKRTEEINVNDRIQYLFIEKESSKDLKKADLAEDPKYAKDNNLKFNRVCYLEQLAKPLLGFYKIVLKDQEDLLDDIIDFVNNKLVKFGGKKLRPSDFKIEDE
jgi:DNA polymerase delta subunit 1